MRILRREQEPPAGTGGSGGERPPSEAPAGETPPAPTPTPTPATPASPSARGAASSEDGDVDLSDLPAGTPDPVREVIRRERRDRQAAQAEARTARQALEERQRAEMSEQERLQADNSRLSEEVQRLNEQARTRAVREAVTELAPGLGIADPKLAARLLETKPEDFGEDGTPKRKTLEQKLEALKREYPGITARTRASADAGAGSRSATNEPDINTRIRERLGR